MSAKVFSKQNAKEKVKQHGKSDKLQKVVNESEIQATHGSTTVSKSFLQDQMNLQQLIAKAEAIQSLHVVESNQSFRLIDKDSKRFRDPFPDSKIAAGYPMHADKTQYIIVYGIALFVKDFIIHKVQKKEHIVDLFLSDTVPAKTHLEGMKVFNFAKFSTSKKSTNHEIA